MGTISRRSALQAPEFHANVQDCQGGSDQWPKSSINHFCLERSAPPRLSRPGSRTRRRSRTRRARRPRPRRSRRSRSSSSATPHKDSSNFLHTNANYEQTRFYPNAQINRGNVGASASGLDLLDRGQGVAGDVADHRRWRHVRHHVLQPRLRARRQDRRRRSGTSSPSSARSRHSAAGPTIAASRSMTTRSMSRRSIRSSTRSMRSPATSSGRCRSPIPRRDTARRWRRPPSTARS